jgi:hypothetical protein
MDDHHLKARINTLSDLNALKRFCCAVEGIQKAVENSGKYQKRDIDAAIEAAETPTISNALPGLPKAQ